MASYGIRRTRAGRIVVRLDKQDRAVLGEVVRGLVHLVEPEPFETGDPLADLVGIDPGARAPTDPVLARLLPDGYDADEPDSSAEFRRFTERGLRQGKVANAQRVLTCLDRPGRELTLDEPDVAAWLGCLNDLRLVLGTRLEVSDDPDAMSERLEELGRTVLEARAAGEATPEAARALEQLGAYQAYDWLTFLQGTLLEAISGIAAD